MSCHVKSSLTAVNTSAQTLAVNSIVSLSELNRTGCGITFGGGTAPIRLKSGGLYLVDVTANILGTTAGVVTLQLLNNGVAVQGATASVTTSIGLAYNVHITALVDVLQSCNCQNNINNLQVQLLTTPAIVNSVRVDAVKLS